MANESIYAAFERMWQYITTVLEKRVDKTTYNTDVNTINNSLNSKAITYTKQVPLNGATSEAGAWQIGINKWTVSDVLESDNPFVGIVYSGDDETDENYDNTMTKIRWIRTGDGYIEVYATGEIDIAIPIQLKVVR